jgi:hypothetical protein
MDFKDLFSRDKERMERVIRGNTAEQSHIRRCLSLAEAIDWKNGRAGPQFRFMLRKKGTLILDETVKRINSLLSRETAPELRNQREFLCNVMFAHDLGKYNREKREFDGANHEERSADLVTHQKDDLLQELRWQKESVHLFINLVRHHGSLGIVRLGEASIVFLSPLISFLSCLRPERRILFLDFLIIVTCCDAGASGAFLTGKFYLDYSRISFYSHLTKQLLAFAEKNDMAPYPEAYPALLEQASGFVHTAARIRSIVTSGNRLSVSRRVLDSVLKETCSSGEFIPRKFALTRFDHGAYVFEPLLAELQKGRRSVSNDHLRRLLLLFGMLCKSKESLNILEFRDSFSVKSGLGAGNRANFRELSDAVQEGDPRRIRKVLAGHGFGDR